MEHILNNINKIYSKKNILKKKYFEKKEIYLFYSYKINISSIITILEENFKQFTFKRLDPNNMTLDNVYISIDPTIEEYNYRHLYIPSSCIFIHIIMHRINDKTNILEKNIIEFYDNDKIFVDNLTKLINNAFNYIKKRKVTNIIYYNITGNYKDYERSRLLIFLIQFKYYNTNFVEGSFNLYEKNNIIFIGNVCCDINGIITLLKDHKIIPILLGINNNYIDISSYGKIIIIDDLDINIYIKQIHSKIENTFGIYQNT